MFSGWPFYVPLPNPQKFKIVLNIVWMHLFRASSKNAESAGAGNGYHSFQPGHLYASSPNSKIDNIDLNRVFGIFSFGLSRKMLDRLGPEIHVFFGRPFI